MKVSEKRWIRLRICTVAAVIVLGLGVILARAFQLQVWERDRLEEIARAGYRGTVPLTPQRGTIFDREGHELAITVQVASVYAHPNQVQDKAKAAKALARVLRESEYGILKVLKKKRAFVWIKRRIPPEKAALVKALQIPGVDVVEEARRFYPNREIGAHMIGFVGIDNEGLEGIEKSCDGLLRGPQTHLIQMKDALGRPFFLSSQVSMGREPSDVYLTIDMDIQYQAQEALRSAVAKTKALNGHCIVMDPRTGEILAVAVVPEFNPNIFHKYECEHWRNRAVADCFEPGSTIKAFLLAAALEERVVGPTTQFDCEQGLFEIAGKTIHDTHAHGVLSVSDIVALSSNIGTVKIGLRLGYERFYRHLERFGFGTTTSSGLLGERSGYLRPPGEARAIDQATTFFGQGLTATSLQLAAAMAAIANGGELMRPYVILRVVDGSGAVIEQGTPRVVRRALSRQTSEEVAKILRRVVSEDGTGGAAIITGFVAAGKTGTAQKVDPETGKYSRTRYVSTFVGFAPAEDPRVVIQVTIDEPQGTPYGGLVAGPVFSQLGLWCMNHLRVNPQVRAQRAMAGPWTIGGNNAPPATVPKASGGVPDFRGLTMREVLTAGRALGLKVVIEGSGFAYQQEPAPGSPIAAVKAMKVRFRPPA